MALKEPDNTAGGNTKVKREKEWIKRRRIQNVIVEIMNAFVFKRLGERVANQDYKSHQNWRLNG